MYIDITLRKYTRELVNYCNKMWWDCGIIWGSLTNENIEYYYGKITELLQWETSLKKKRFSVESI